MSKKNIKTRSTPRYIASIIEDPIGWARSVETKKLVAVLERMSTMYYNTSTPFVDDAIYDQLIDYLREKDPDNEFLYRVGAAPDAKHAVELPYAMPSLNKIKPGEKNMEQWFQKYNGPYVISDKLDGVSAQVYRSADGYNLYTRGDALYGRRITHLLKYMIPKKVMDRIPIGMSIRGEIMMSRDMFEEVSDQYRNPRNTVSGIVNSDQPDERMIKRLQLICYQVIEPRMNQVEQFREIESLGLNAAWNRLVTKNDMIAWRARNDEDHAIDMISTYLINCLRGRKSESKFDIDGLVLMDCSEVYPYESTNPTYAVAFKINSEENMRNATIEEIIWEPTMYGLLKPVIRIKPIELSGTTVTYCTAINARFVVENKIGRGSVVRLVRSGDVIPKIVSIVQPNKNPDLPKIPYRWNESKVDLKVINPNKATTGMIAVKRMMHFFKTIGVKYLSQGILTKFYDYGYHRIADIISCCYQREIIDASGIGEKMLEKIYNEIDRAFSRIRLHELMSASLIFGHGLGTNKLKEVLKKYPNILHMKRLSDDDIYMMVLEVDGFADLSAKKFSKSFRKFKDFLEELKDVTTYNLDFKTNQPPQQPPRPTRQSQQPPNQPQQHENAIDMKDWNVCMTGTRDKKIVEFIESNGGQISNTVGKKTTLLLYIDRDDVSSKMKRAIDLGIPTMSVPEFVGRYIDRLHDV